jgi:hypothetical protein
MKYDNVVDETYDKIYTLYKERNPYSELNEKGVKKVKDVLREWAETDWENLKETQEYFQYMNKLGNYRCEITQIFFPSLFPEQCDIDSLSKSILEHRNFQQSKETILITNSK